METELIRPYTESEVQEAVFQMCPTKAPGLDGFLALFFQKSWRLVRSKVSRNILQMLNEGRLEDGLNKTLITLIPKVKEPERIEEFRPISLCNVVAKIVTKMLANMLKPILPSIISENQSAFLPGKLIFDNIIAAHELIHYIRTRGDQKRGYFALKLDISKAYDRVEWDYLELIMKRLGFPEKWIVMVMNCVTSVSYMIRINDWVTEEIKPRRGIRQPDPLSPFLFLICTEWLSMKVNECQRRKSLNGIKISRGAPEVTHRLFADDSIFFLRADSKNAENLKRILAEYEIISGQKVNLSKSEIFFGGNVPESDRDRICEILGVRQVNSMSRYLGLPVAFGHNRTELCKYIVERIWKKVQGWKEKTLSIAGKETLIKAVLQAMPTYAMSCFKIPESLIKRIVSIISNYWWSNSKLGRGIFWCKYGKLCEEKLEGGLGFRELSTFNDALLAKQIWRLLERPDSLVTSLLKMRYFKDSTPISCQLGSRPPFVWRSIWNAGQKIKQWIDPNSEGLRPRWMMGGSGVFSTKSVYKSLKMQSDQLRRNQMGEQADMRRVHIFWKTIWRLNVQPKVRVFAWRLLHNFLPSGENLSRRGMTELRDCPVCGFKGESTVHTILFCWWARSFWQSLRVDCSFLLHDFRHPEDWLWYCVFKYDALELSIIVQGARHIWFNRNNALNENKVQNPLVSARCVLHSRWLAYHSQQKLVVTDMGEGRKWTKPGEGTVKINVDGAWDSTAGMAGVALCCRDDKGAVCFIEAQSTGEAASSFEAELRALTRAMEVAGEKNITSIIFETDCAHLKKTILQGPSAGEEELESIRWCRRRLEDNMQWSLNLVLREANSVADLLAKKALRESWNWKSHDAIPMSLSCQMICESV
ncbi:hypothetical protein QQ045_011440 [Rhodiola kirilowii]